jgi:prolyl-tRNA editing enzyme YbaK/EbsC (Cys-tRNA(Pro) deacylase)
MGRGLPPSAQRVQDALVAGGFTNEVIVLDRPTRTAAEAATALGCEVAQIAKSLVFRRAGTGAPILIITSGANRVDERAIAAAIGEPIGRATAEFVRETTGFAIGGVPPIGHARPIETLVDEDLTRFDEIWAAAGHPSSLFRVTAAELRRMTGARVVSVKAA